MPAPVPFVRQVRHALSHLYDPDILRSHPLASAMGIDGGANVQTRLRELLVGAVDGLKPASSTPVGSRTWRVYKVLQCRYVQQMDQKQTAHQLGVSVRHLRREQRVAVQALADSLFQAYESNKVTPSAEDSSEETTTLQDELSWLNTSVRAETGSIEEAIQAAVHVVRPLAQSCDTTLEAPNLPRLPSIAIHPAALRQAVVSATTCAIRRSMGGQVSISAQQQGQRVVLHIMGAVSERIGPGREDTRASLEAARTLLRMHDGQLECDERGRSLCLTLSLPVSQVTDVLLVDDNIDVHQLFARYLVGTPYRIHATASAEQLLDLVKQHNPGVIVLDVMIPGVDGWEFLGRLRQHPLTSSLPVVICTVLPERDLAMALGASCFLPKPVSRQSLLHALALVRGEEQIGSR